MSGIEHFFWLLDQAFSGFGVGGPIPLIVICIAFLINNPFQASRYHHRNWFAFAPFVLSLLILLMGTIYSSSSSGWAESITFTIGFLHVPCLIYSVWRLKGIRWFTAVVNLTAMRCSFWALFVAGMAISGDWI